MESLFEAYETLRAMDQKNTEEMKERACQYLDAFVAYTFPEERMAYVMLSLIFSGI